MGYVMRRERRTPATIQTSTGSDCYVIRGEEHLVHNVDHIVEIPVSDAEHPNGDGFPPCQDCNCRLNPDPDYVGTLEVDRRYCLTCACGSRYVVETE